MGIRYIQGQNEGNDGFFLRNDVVDIFKENIMVIEQNDFGFRERLRLNIYLCVINLQVIEVVFVGKINQESTQKQKIKCVDIKKKQDFMRKVEKKCQKRES